MTDSNNHAHAVDIRVLLDRQTGRQANRQAGTQTHKYPETQSGRHMERQTDRQRHTDGQVGSRGREDHA